MDSSGDLSMNFEFCHRASLFCLEITSNTLGSIMDSLCAYVVYCNAQVIDKYVGIVFVDYAAQVDGYCGHHEE
jgi:hypothetical protein